MLTEKPKLKSIVITIRDRNENKSKSITIYNTSVNEIYVKIERLIQKEAKNQ